MTIATLRQVPLFESLDDEAARKLCQLLQSIDCKAKTPLFRAGDEGDAMYLIERGKVRNFRVSIFFPSCAAARTSRWNCLRRLQHGKHINRST